MSASMLSLLTELKSLNMARSRIRLSLMNSTTILKMRQTVKSGGASTPKNLMVLRNETRTPRHPGHRHSLRLEQAEGVELLHAGEAARAVRADRRQAAGMDTGADAGTLRFGRGKAAGVGTGKNRKMEGGTVMTTIEYLQDQLERNRLAEATSYWGGALMLVQAFKANGQVDYEEAAVLEREILSKLKREGE